jgi:hypothetical protein
VGVDTPYTSTPTTGRYSNGTSSNGRLRLMAEWSTPDVSHAVVFMVCHLHYGRQEALIRFCPCSSRLGCIGTYGV